MTRSRTAPEFTLAELLVTIAIVGVLLAIALPVLSGAARRSRELACLANIREANTVATAWSLENRDLPPYFETSPYHIDSLGVPSMQMRIGVMTMTRPYFDQTFLWLRAIVPEGARPPRELTCASIDIERLSRNGTNQHVSTTYHLSSALLADPAAFTPETMDDHTPAMFTPQALTKASHPSTKAFLSEQTVAHVDGSWHETIELRTPAAPVSFVDGHASVELFTEAVHAPIPADGPTSQAFMHTVRGVLGSDLP